MEQDTAFNQIFALFFDDAPTEVRVIDTGRGEDDFRVTFIVETDAGNKVVLKLADNDFTFPEKIAVWQRTVEEYRKLGYDCPRIFADKTVRFPVVEYNGRRCAAYAEAFSPYRPAEDRFSEDFGQNEALYESYKRDIWRMTARIAAQYFDYSPYPSAYCLFETFCPSDKTDEVLDNALAWKELADKLNLHETTVGRAIRDKYIRTPAGLVPFSAFFSGGFASDSGEEIAPDAVKKLISEAIAAEDPNHPLSDGKIEKILLGKGLKVARRTIAKYREEMDIPSSFDRRKELL